MAERKADGAGLDFEPVPALNPLGKYYVPFVASFRDAMKARFPDATLVNATSAGAASGSSGARRRGRPPDGHDLQLPLVGLDESPAPSPRSTTRRATSRSTSPGSSSGHRPITSCSACRTTATTGRSRARSRNATVQTDKKTYGARLERHVRDCARLPGGPPEGQTAATTPSRAAPTTPTGRRSTRPTARSTSRTSAASPPSTTTS